MTTMNTPSGELVLERYPTRDDDLLLPFDAADSLLLDELSREHPHARRVLVIGDRHGALTTALAADREVTMWSDSMLARIATERNLAANDRRAQVVGELTDGDFDLVLVRPAKARALLEAQLHQTAGLITHGTPVVLGEMVKHLGRWMTDVLEKQIGPTQASLAHRKARLLRSVRDERTASAPQWSCYEAPGGIEVHSAPGTFAASGVDAGARLLLDCLPTGMGSAQVVDLGCGNGILATASALGSPQASYTLVDESAAAIDSARRTWQASLPGRAARFEQADGLGQLAAGSVDVVLCNPPFHSGTTVDEWVGRRLLTQARATLRPGGELYVVANRHVNHHSFLREAFSASDVLAANPKFSVLRAVR